MKTKLFSLFLMLSLIFNSFYFTTINSFAIEEISGSKNTPIILEYDEIENGKVVHFVETVNDYTVETKKYQKDGNGNLNLIDIINTKIIVKSNGDIFAEMKSTKYNTITKKDILKNQQNIYNNATLYSKNYVWHPEDYRYYEVMSVSGHLGFSNLTDGVITAAIFAIFGKGSIVRSSLAGLVNTIRKGGFKNVYYKKITYYPHQKYNIKGLPIWKERAYFFADREKTRQVGPVQPNQAFVFVK